MVVGAAMATTLTEVEVVAVAVADLVHQIHDNNDLQNIGSKPEKRLDKGTKYRIIPMTITTQQAEAATP